MVKNAVSKLNGKISLVSEEGARDPNCDIATIIATGVRGTIGVGIFLIKIS